MSKNVTIEKQNNLYAVIRENKSILGKCQSIKETVRVCNSLECTILNMDYVLSELYNEA